MLQLRPFSPENFDKLTADLTATNWDAIIYLHNVHDIVHIFIEKLNYLYCQNFPRKTKFLNIKRFQKPWLTQNIMRLIRQKSDYFKQYKLGIISKSFNNRFKVKVNKEIVKSKK